MGRWLNKKQIVNCITVTFPFHNSIFGESYHNTRKSERDFQTGAMHCSMGEGPFCLLRQIARGKVAWWRIATRSVGIAANNCANCRNLPISEAKRCIGTVPNDWQEFNIAKIVVCKSAPNCCQLSQTEKDQSKLRQVITILGEEI